MAGFRFSMEEPLCQPVLENKLQALAEPSSLVYKDVALEDYAGQVKHEEIGRSCRLGVTSGQPFSSMTSTIDFCGYPHFDSSNHMEGGFHRGMHPLKT